MLRVLFGLLLLVSALNLQGQSSWTISEKPGLEITAFPGGNFGRISGVGTFPDGTIAVADDRNFEVYLFHPNGKFRARFGGRGSGPKEFQFLEWIGQCGPGGAMFIEDPLLARLTSIDASGQVLSMATVKNPSQMRRCGSGGRQVFLGRGLVTTFEKDGQVGPYRPMVSVLVSREGEAGARQLGFFPGSERFRYPATDGPRVLGRQTLVAVTATSVYVGTADSFFVQRYGYNGALQGVVRGPKGVVAKRLTSEDREEWLRRREQRLPPGYDPKASTKRLRVQMDMYQDFPKEVPVYQRFLVEGERLWVEEGHRPTETTRTWWGFDLEGRAVARLTLPEAFEAFEISQTYVLGKWVNDNGEESVRSHQIIQKTR